MESVSRVSGALQMVVNDFSPPQCLNERCRDVFPDFVAFVVIPAAVLLILVLFLTCVMCCGRIGTEKRLRSTTDSELVLYTSIRRASVSLRQLSEKRDTPLDIRSASMSLDRSKRRQRPGRVRGNAPHSAPSTLERRKPGRETSPPPPYPPPKYPYEDDDSYLKARDSWVEVQSSPHVADGGAGAAAAAATSSNLHLSAGKEKANRYATR